MERATGAAGGLGSEAERLRLSEGGDLALELAEGSTGERGGSRTRENSEFLSQNVAGLGLYSMELLLIGFFLLAICI